MNPTSFLSRLLPVAAILALTCSFTAPTARALPADAVASTVITSNSTNLLFYVWGRMDGNSFADTYFSNPAGRLYSLTEMMYHNRMMADLCSQSPAAFSYFTGVAEALAQAIERSDG